MLRCHHLKVTECFSVETRFLFTLLHIVCVCVCVFASRDLGLRTDITELLGCFGHLATHRAQLAVSRAANLLLRRQFHSCCGLFRADCVTSLNHRKVPRRP